LLTKKQREEKQMAEIRKQALIASGAQIEGLQQAGTSTSTLKKVVYGNRKKRGLAGKDTNLGSSRPRSPELEAASPRLPVQETYTAGQSSVNDYCDVSTDEKDTKTAAPGGIKDSWDDSTDEEAEKSSVTPAIGPETRGKPPTEGMFSVIDRSDVY
jgi:translation initiation factor 5B